MLGVYVHIPFCSSKCNYCAFSSFVTGQEEKERYFDHLIKEIKEYAKEKKEIDSIYIGGGTPSLIDENLMQKLFDSLKECFVWSDNIEFTIECNPCSLTESKLQLYKKNGVNRISLGVQSLEDDKLAFIGRKHTASQALDAITMAKKYFDNISCDLLIGLKGLDKLMFLGQFGLLASMGVKHISAYLLQVEEDTPLAKMVEKDENLLPDDDTSVEAYQEMIDVLQTLGYSRYEVSNFAQNGYESRHNFKYWTGDDYVGFGLGAHSLENGVRWANSSKFEDYYAGKIKGRETLSNLQKIEEHIMLGFRCKAGVSKQKLLSLGYDITKNENYSEVLANDIIIENGDKLILNPDFYGVSNYIIVKLLPEN